VPHRCGGCWRGCRLETGDSDVACRAGRRRSSVRRPCYRQALASVMPCRLRPAARDAPATTLHRQVGTNRAGHQFLSSAPESSSILARRQLRPFDTAVGVLLSAAPFVRRPGMRPPVRTGLAPLRTEPFSVSLLRMPGWILHRTPHPRDRQPPPLPTGWAALALRWLACASPGRPRHAPETGRRCDSQRHATLTMPTGQC
jgi:hypothetical protein